MTRSTMRTRSAQKSIFLFIVNEAYLLSSDVVLKGLARESGEKKGAETPVDLAPL
jgi:hypothetical protein